MFIELGIREKHSNLVKYCIKRNYIQPLDVSALAKQIIEEGIKDKHEPFFYGKTLEDFEFFINDIG